ncbi:hypothetical protein QJS04_geneDACA002426 [Acorus gramineus]|uniref:Vacuolar membrane protease n=1 Tax=Acorus gramineus TaxID=55184 RepID=A0AAV9AA84_ACOGR|nr:hypothetical protein QJS04_geneDACA002426 [Acorus gramineus]
MGETMRRRRSENTSSSNNQPEQAEEVEETTNKNRRRRPHRSAFVWFSLLILLFNGSWAVFHLQFERLPDPLPLDRAGKRGFSEVSAMAHVTALTAFGPHPVGSDALDLAVQYVLEAAEKIKKTAHWEVDVEVDLFRAEPGVNQLVGGLFKGKSLVYADLKHVVLRIVPKYLTEARENAILVSSHIDTVFSTGGAGDCSSCVAVMLELARGVSNWAHGFKNSVIFLFNTGEEEGLNGAHSFITQHPWSGTIRSAVDLEAIGVGGKSSIFQTGSDPWAIESFARVAKYPSGQVIAQDLFLSGAIKSATDFQVYKEVAGLSGLDFAYADTSAVYHTKNDKLKLLKPGSLQHLGENMLAFLLQAGSSSYIANGKASETEPVEKAIYFDILGMYMVVYHERLASLLHNSVVLQALLIWTTSLFMGDGLAEATLTPARAPRQLKIITLLVGLTVPVLVSAGVFIQLVGSITANLVRFDRSPGSTPDWLGNMITAAAVSAVVCLTLVYLLSYVHLSAGVFPAFTEDISRTVNVVHVVDTSGGFTANQKPLSHVYIFSNTPGKLTNEIGGLKDERIVCEKARILDLVTFTVEYGCWSTEESESGWSKEDTPVLHVESDSTGESRKTVVSIDTKVSNRWALAINTKEIEDFKLEGNEEEMVPVGDKTSIDGWHTIQFSGGKDSPKQFKLTLFWFKNATRTLHKENKQIRDSDLLLKLRTDVNRITPKTARILDKLPPWVSQFGKSTSPYTLAFLNKLPVDL